MISIFISMRPHYTSDRKRLHRDISSVTLR